MRHARPALALLVLSTLLPSSALARGTRSRHVDRDSSDDMLADVLEPPTAADVSAGLARAREEIAQCLETSAYVGSVRVSARIDVSHALTVTVTPRRADAVVRTCVELAAQRQLANVASRDVRRTLRGTITVRRDAARAPPAPRPSVDR